MTFPQNSGITVFAVEMIHSNEFLYNSCDSKKKNKHIRGTHMQDRTCPGVMGRTGIPASQVSGIYVSRRELRFRIIECEAGEKCEDSLIPQFTYEKAEG